MHGLPNVHVHSIRMREALLFKLPSLLYGQKCGSGIIFDENKVLKNEAAKMIYFQESIAKRLDVICKNGN